MMTPRERVLTALDHEEPDRVPIDLGSTHVTGISVIAYNRLREYLEMPQKQPIIIDDVQQVALPHNDIIEHFNIDVRGLFPITSNNITKPPEDCGDRWRYEDEWGLVHEMEKEGGLYYSLVESPMDAATISIDEIAAHDWPNGADPERIEGLRQQAGEYRAAGYPVVLKGVAAGLCEVASRIRGMENFLCDLMTDEAVTGAILDKILEIKIDFWEMAFDELADVVDIALEADDYGTQQTQLVPPDRFRDIFKPRLRKLFAAIDDFAPHTRLLFHSCGSVRDIIGDFIEIGVDILNPIHITAEGMEPAALKQDFGDDISFWGGGVDTQGILPGGTPQQVRDDVAKNLQALAGGGGYVFNTVHNIQPDVPPENLVAMYDAVNEFGSY